MDKVQSLIKTILDKLNLLDYEERLSLSNVTVAIFVLICAVRMAFGGSTLTIGSFKWVIQTIDVSGTLPVLYGLLNYSHKRMTTNQVVNNQTNGSSNV
jgi:hypothetical protein